MFKLTGLDAPDGQLDSQLAIGALLMDNDGEQGWVTIRNLHEEKLTPTRHTILFLALRRPTSTDGLNPVRHPDQHLLEKLHCSASRGRCWGPPCQALSIASRSRFPRLFLMVRGPQTLCRAYHSRLLGIGRLAASLPVAFPVSADSGFELLHLLLN